MYKEHRRLYFDSSLRKWNQEVLSDADASSEFSSLCECDCDCGVENLEHVTVCGSRIIYIHMDWK